MPRSSTAAAVAAFIRSGFRTSSGRLAGSSYRLQRSAIGGACGGTIAWRRLAPASTARCLLHSRSASRSATDLPPPVAGPRSVAVAAAIASLGSRRGARRGSGSGSRKLPRRRDPRGSRLCKSSLHADDAVGGVRFGKAVIDVGAQRVQRKLALQIPFAARDFGAVQAAGTRTLIPLQPNRSAESTALRIARRNATRFSSCSAIDSATSCASSSGLCTS